ncbi:MAG: ABC transporter permease subunit [Anaerolineae bacterium]|nr:ABC transporter permease subunit [Anaerolineae bacterium]NUQ03055.1 ABC transporter permease subunit [Anaerolineae bacterium]
MTDLSSLPPMSSPTGGLNHAARRAESRSGKPVGPQFGRALNYLILFVGATIMLFPLLWMFTSSFKPEWQILAQPPIWIPSTWIHAQAGSTTQEFPLWWAVNPDGEREEVLKVGVRRFTTVIDVSQMPELIAAPADRLSDAQPTAMDSVTFNVRTLTLDDGTTRQVVAIARDGENLVVAAVDDLRKIAAIRPLDEVNAGKRANVEIGGYRLQARELEEEGVTLLALGPESELTVVAPQEVASAAVLVPAEAVEEAGLAPFGSTELPVYTLADHPEAEKYVLLSAESWQPIIDLEQARASGFTVENSALSASELRTVNGTPDMPVATAGMEDGSQREVVLLVETSALTFVIPVDEATTLRLTPLGKLAQPFVANLDGVSVSYRDDYVEGDQRHAIAIVSERRDMALIAPQAVVEQAFDVPSESLSAVLTPNFSLQNYVDALSKDLGGATFFTFFRNSGLLVLLNLIGHFLSVTLVAYAFARLRAPGKNFLFMVLLSTMMLPFPVMLIPTFEIFQKLGMINTLWPLFVRSFFGNAFLIFLLRQFFMAIPMELEEAARIDGATTLQVLVRVILPLSAPALATVGIFTFWWTWNSFFEPYVYLSSPQQYTVSLGLAFFKGQYNTSFHLLMAASMVVILPIILIFFFAQRYFIEGIQLTGLKG